MADKKIHFKVKRQDGPAAQPYWEEFAIPYAPQHNVVSALMEHRKNPTNLAGEKIKPVCWDCNCMEEVCGACSMVINGVPRQSCATLCDDLEQPIVLEPLTKFPVLRDLMVDRDRMFQDNMKVNAWEPLDGTWTIHTGAPRIDPEVQNERYAYSRCMICGCCMEACPQYHEASAFIGPQPLGQVYMHNLHPTGKYLKEKRLHAIMQQGGISDCANAQNCVEVCPKQIPLTTGIGKLHGQTTAQFLKDLFRS